MVAEATGEARGKAMVETLPALLEDVDRLPENSLAATQEAAMRLVRRIASRTPELLQQVGGTGGDAAMWWTLDRHHGLGNLATTPRMTGMTVLSRGKVTEDDGCSLCIQTTLLKAHGGPGRALHRGTWTSTARSVAAWSELVPRQQLSRGSQSTQ